MKVPAQLRNAKRLIPLKIVFAISCAIVLSLVPKPLFAQHGGGGGGSHGGGSSGGGHSSGGSHSSGGGHSGPAAGSSGSSGGGGMRAGGATHLSVSNVPASNAPYAGSHLWIGQGSGSSIASMHIERFAAANNTWQDPPSSPVRSSGKAGAAGQNNLAAARSRGPHLANPQAVRPPIVFVPQPRRRFFGNNFFFFGGGGCFGGFFPGFCGSGLWWGPGYGWTPGCDPVLGCTGYGYPNYGLDAPDDMQTQSEMPPREEYGPFRWQDPVDRESADLLEASKPAATIYLKDGTTYGVTDHWLAGGNLHYVTNYGGENCIAVERLDLQRTVNENTAVGMNFILSNQPSPRQ